MCGIAGIIYADRHRPVDPAMLKAMGDCDRPSRPGCRGILDRAGSRPGASAAVDHRPGRGRPADRQRGRLDPGRLQRRDLQLPELRRELEARGHRFQTQSDTEVLVHLYEEHGDRLVDRLRGMFAFALWDRTSRRLVLARDRLGLKPLYVYRDAEKLVFGSELKAILACPGVPARSILRRWRTTWPTGWSPVIGRSSSASRSCRRPMS